VVGRTRRISGIKLAVHVIGERHATAEPRRPLRAPSAAAVRSAAPFVPHLGGAVVNQGETIEIDDVEDMPVLAVAVARPRPIAAIPANSGLDRLLDAVRADARRLIADRAIYDVLCADPEQRAVAVRDAMIRRR